MKTVSEAPAAAAEAEVIDGAPEAPAAAHLTLEDLVPAPAPDPLPPAA